MICTESGLGSHAPTLEGLTKQVAYFAGPAVLDTILPYVRDSGRELTQRTATDDNPGHDPLAERLDLLMQVKGLATDGKTSVSLVKVAADLIQNLPEYRPTQRWTGVFAQIVSPFEGELTSTACEFQSEGKADQQAA